MPFRVWIVAAWLPLLVVLVALAVQGAWLPELPDPIATHWGADGPDGFGPAWSSLVLTAGVGLGLSALFSAILLSARGPAPVPLHKWLAVISLVASLFTVGTSTATLGIQRGLADARDAPGLGIWLFAALGVALVAGAVAWFLLPTAVSPLAHAVDAAPRAPAAGESGTWTATTRMSSGALAAILVAIAVAVAVSVFAIIVSDGLAWPIALLPVLLLALSVIATSWRVRVDPEALTVSAQPLGWPRVRIPVDQIARVQISQVEPLSEFGGWGWRWAPGRSFGVITRRGEAIEVTRRDGRRFTVTVDGAAPAAALLAAHSASATHPGERYP